MIRARRRILRWLRYHGWLDDHQLGQQTRQRLR